MYLPARTHFPPNSRGTDQHTIKTVPDFRFSNCAIVAMTNAHAPKRRWLRFSLRTLFVVLTAAGVWLGWNVYRVRERARVQHDIAWRGAQILSPGFYARRAGNAADHRKLPALLPMEQHSKSNKA